MINRWLNRYIMMKLPKRYSGETMFEELSHLKGGIGEPLLYYYRLINKSKEIEDI
jgi:hypothetical protein